MRLTDFETRICDGTYGEARRLALRVLLDLGDLFGAEEMMPVSQVHIDMTLYMVDAGLAFIEHLAGMGARFSVPVSLNAASIDQIRWREYRTPPDLLHKCRRLEKAYLQMGASPTWTCAPYQQGLIPKFGEQIAWGESNAIAFANSVIGARTNRYGDLMDVCAAIIGKVPKFGLHLTENRKAEMLIRLNGVTREMLDDQAIYPLLGFLHGELAGDRVAVIEGIPGDVPIDCLKGFCAAAASAGAVGLFHMAGVTPEVQTLEMCLDRGHLPAVMEITPAMIQDAEESLTTAKESRIDLVVVGCPHFSFAELRELVRLLRGRKIHREVVFWAFTSRSTYGWIENCGMLAELKESGVMVFTDGCPLQYPKKAWDFQTAFTHSAKFANYCFSQTGLNVAYGGLKDCVESAVQGKICRKRSRWRKNS